MGADAHHVHSAVLNETRNDERSNVTAAREAPPLWLTLAQLAGIAAVIAIVVATGTWKVLLVAFWMLPLYFAISNARKRGRS